MSQETIAKIKELAQQTEQYVIDLRREFHMYPEPSCEEERTSKRIQEELGKMGIPFEVLPDRSVIGVVEGGAPGKTLAIRGDIDALRLQDDKDVPYKSKIDGVMHACGHDAHAAMLLGIGKMLLDIKGQLKGTVKLVFHIGEEIGEGYKEILAYFKRTGGVDRIIATHVWIGLNIGEISVEPGPRMAGASGFLIEVTGRGGHGSRPDQSISPILPLCDIVMKMPYVPEYFYNVMDTSVVSVGKIRANADGGANILPNSATAEGGFRFFTPEGKKAIPEYMERIIKNVAKAYGAEGTLTLTGGIEPVFNDEATVKMAREVVDEMDNLVNVPFDPICASDCYGMLLQEYPGCYCYMGVRNDAKGINYAQHHVKYDIDEDVMKRNCEFMCRYAIKYLA